MIAVWGGSMPAESRPDARMGIKTFGREYRFIFDTKELAAKWENHLTAAWLNVSSIIGDAEKVRYLNDNSFVSDANMDEDDGTDGVQSEIDDYIDFFMIPRTEERCLLLTEALKMGNERQALYDKNPSMPKPQVIHVIYNPVSGGGTAMAIVDMTVTFFAHPSPMNTSDIYFFALLVGHSHLAACKARLCDCEDHPSRVCH